MCKIGTEAAYLSHHLVSIYIIYGMQAQSGKIIPFFHEKPKVQIFMWIFPIFKTLKRAKQNMSVC